MHPDLLLWDEADATIKAHADRLDAAREYCEVFFIDALHTICHEKGWDAPHYLVRPPPGLRLEEVVQGRDMVVAIRPRWTPRRTGRHHVEPYADPVLRRVALGCLLSVAHNLVMRPLELFRKC
jgi:hypothetical protein